MSTSEPNRLYAAINAKLASLLESSPDLPSWHERWKNLGEQSTDEERLGVYQAIRDSGFLPASAGFYLVSWQIDNVASRRSEKELSQLEEQLSAIEEAEGLTEEGFWSSGEAPDEYVEILEQYQDTWYRIFAATLDEHGERAMASLFRTDPAEFERRSEAGQEFFHGPLPADFADVPAWLDSLIEDVAASMTSQNLLGPLGFLWSEEDGFCEVDVYPAPVELVGGSEDGAVVSPGFSLDLENLRTSFDRVDDLGWNAFGWPNGDGPFVWVEGAYHEREVFLRVMAQAPEDEEPGAKYRLPGLDPE